MKAILELKNLNLFYDKFHAIKDVNLAIKPGEILGLIGESGSGKSSLANSIMGLIPKPISRLNGSIIYNNNNLLSLEAKDLSKIRGKDISIIFQSHSSALNPVLRVNIQVAETISTHKKISKKAAIKEAEKLLVKLEIPQDQVTYYPHQLSGGMKQRVMIATAIANNTKILIADEPTTALDPNIEQGVIRQLYKLNKDLGLSILFVSHDINLLATISDRLAIMYGGIIVEIGKNKNIIQEPIHPYSKRLIESLYSTELKTLKVDIRKKACPYANNCELAKDVCLKKMPKEKTISGRVVRCHMI